MRISVTAGFTSCNSWIGARGGIMPQLRFRLSEFKDAVVINLHKLMNDRTKVGLGGANYSWICTLAYRPCDRMG